MLLNVVRSLYQYNIWANHRILEATTDLTSEQFLASAVASYPSVRDTLVHIMSAEWSWLSRWKGTSPSAKFVPTKFSNLLSIQACWDAFEREMQNFIDRLNPQMLSKTITYIS